MRAAVVCLTLGFFTAASADARPATHVTHVWHVDRSDPESPLCKESGPSRIIIVYGAGSAARYDQPTAAQWTQSGCAGSKPSSRPMSQHELAMRMNAQLRQMQKPLTFDDLRAQIDELRAKSAPE
jgi:hypothetical protein